MCHSCNTDFFADIPEGDLGSAPAQATLPAKADPLVPVAPKGFKCPKCHGSGRYNGVRVHQEESVCFKCGGRGWVKMDPAVAKERHRKAERTKEQNRQARTADFIAEHKPLFEALSAVSDWNDFARSLRDQILSRGSLTENQIAAANRMLTKIAQREEEKKASQAAKSGEVNAERIREMFAKAKASGLKRPAFVAGGLRLTLASEYSRSPGAIYIVQDGQYAGKIVGNKFLATRYATAETRQRIELLSGNPQEAARAFGKETGTCCCCGRTLSDPVSVEAGIGPICANKWGL